MQGRLSPLVDDRIQAFPWSDWRGEFPAAESLGFHLMEWTLDQGRLHENPLMEPVGREEIRTLGERHGLKIPSLTGDCFMQAPFWKATLSERANLQRDFLAVVGAAASLGIKIVVMPLVDSGRVDSPKQEDALVTFLSGHTNAFWRLGVRIAFETDQAPDELARFIDRLEPEVFGVNYDIGNSAALGFDPAEELSRYGHRVVNVHVKDRLRGGTTVPLGLGNANFQAVFLALSHAGYRGNCILQTARAADGQHGRVLAEYRDMTASWLSRDAS